MVNTIIFDLGGVLLDLDMHQCFERVEALGVDMNKLSKATTEDNLGVGASICEGMSASGILHLYQIGKISTEDFIRTIQEMSKEGTTYKQVLDAWNSCLLTIPEYKLEFINELQDEGYHIFLLSNTNDAHWHYIMENCFPKPVENYFEKTFLSQEMGMAKPNTEIFKNVLNQIQVPASECLFIDDTRVNCEVAQTLGIHCYNTSVRTDFREAIRKLIYFLES